MNKLIICLLSLASAYAGTVTITQTVVNADGTPASGSVLIRPSGPCKTAGNEHMMLKTITVNFTGTFSVALNSNGACMPTGTNYAATWTVGGRTWTEYWNVPATSGPFLVDDVIQFGTLPSVHWPMPSGGDIGGFADTGLTVRSIQGVTVVGTGAVDQQLLGYDGSGLRWIPRTFTLNGQTGLTHTFSQTNDANVLLAISSANNIHNFALSWSGTLAKNRQHPNTVYVDQNNTFGVFNQDFSASNAFIIRSLASAAPTVAASLAYDQTSTFVKYGTGSATRTFGNLEDAQTYTGAKTWSAASTFNAAISSTAGGTFSGASPFSFTAPAAFTGATTIKSFWGAKDASVYSGANAVAQIDAACADLGGFAGMVSLPTAFAGNQGTGVNTDYLIGSSAWPDRCGILDLRGNYFTTLPGSYDAPFRIVGHRTSDPSNGLRHMGAADVLYYYTGGGVNGNSVKSTFIGLEVAGIFGNRGQHYNSAFVNWSDGAGDSTGPFVQVDSHDVCPEAGGECTEGIRDMVEQNAGSIMTGTISGYNSGTGLLTYTGAANYWRLGLDRPVIDTDAAYTTGTVASVSGNVVTLSGANLVSVGSLPSGATTSYCFSAVQDDLGGAKYVVPVTSISDNSVTLGFVKNAQTDSFAFTTFATNGGGYRVYPCSTIAAFAQPYAAATTMTMTTATGIQSWPAGHHFEVPIGFSQHIEGMRILGAYYTPGSSIYPNTALRIASQAGTRPWEFGVWIDANGTTGFDRFINLSGTLSAHGPGTPAYISASSSSVGPFANIIDGTNDQVVFQQPGLSSNDYLKHLAVGNDAWCFGATLNGCHWTVNSVTGVSTQTGNHGVLSQTAPQLAVDIGGGLTNGLGLEMATPGTPSLTCNATGGTLADGTYFVREVAVDSLNGTTLPGAETSCTITGGGGAGSVTITATSVTGTSLYRAHIGTAAGAETGYISSTTTSLSYTGQALTVASLPTVSTAWATKILASGVTTVSNGGSIAIGSSTNDATSLLVSQNNVAFSRASGQANVTNNATGGSLGFQAGGVTGLQLSSTQATLSVPLQLSVVPTQCSANQWATGNQRNPAGAVNCSQPAAANLSNGVTGSGAVVLAAAPTLSGAVTLTGTLLIPAQANGNATGNEVYVTAGSATSAYQSGIAVTANAAQTVGNVAAMEFWDSNNATTRAAIGTVTISATGGSREAGLLGYTSYQALASGALTEKFRVTGQGAFRVFNNTPNVIGSTTFTGTGLNDLTRSGTTFTYNGATLTYCVQIDATGTPDTFKWGTDNCATFPTAGVAVTGAAQLLSNGMSVTFAATTGHTLTDHWTFALTAAGSTNLFVQAGAAQSGDLLDAYLNDGLTKEFSVSSAGVLTAAGGATLGTTGGTIGTVALKGSTSGTATITPQAVAGTPTLTLPNASGTFAVSASAPLALNTTTGALSITGAAGQVLAGASPAFTATPTLGTNASATGQIGLANGGTSGATVTIQNSAATAAYNFNLPSTAGSANQLLLSGGGTTNPMIWGSRSGNTTTFASTNGTLNSGDLGSFDASGNLQDASIVAANVLTNSVSGTTNTLPKFSAAHTLTNSGLSDNGTTVSTAETVSLSGQLQMSGIPNSGANANGNVAFFTSGTAANTYTSGVAITLNATQTVGNTALLEFWDSNSCSTCRAAFGGYTVNATGGSRETGLTAYTTYQGYQVNENQQFTISGQGITQLYNSAASNIASTTYTPAGTPGVNDGTFGGTFTGTSALTYCAQIDATGTPDTFKWGTDNCATFPTTGVAITGSAQTLSNGVTVTFTATTGHTLNDKWSSAVKPGGSTRLVLKAGVGQGTNDLEQTQSNAGTVVSGTRSDGTRYGPRTLGVQTANKTLTTSDCGSVQSNAGAAGAVQITLPTPPTVGSCEITFIVEAAQNLTAKAAASATIRKGATVGAANGSAVSNVIGNVVTLRSTSATTWIAVPYEPVTAWVIN